MQVQMIKKVFWITLFSPVYAFINMVTYRILYVKHKENLLTTTP